MHIGKGSIGIDVRVYKLDGINACIFMDRYRLQADTEFKPYKATQSSDESSLLRTQSPNSPRTRKSDTTYAYISGPLP